MFRSRIWTLGVAALALAVVAMMANPALAQRRGGWGGFGGRGWGGGYYGGRGWDGGWGGYGWGGYGWGGYGGYGGYYGGMPYYSSGYYSYYPSYYSSDYNYPTVVGSTYSYPSTYQSGYYTPANNNSNDMTATVTVHVPPNAQVWFDDQQTRQGGEFRTYSTPPLTADKTYHYDVRAKWDENGKTMEKKQRVEVRPGRTATVDFLRPDTPESNPESINKPAPDKIDKTDKADNPPKPNPPKNPLPDEK